MRYTKVKRILSGLLTMAMLAGQAPQVMAAGTDGFDGDGTVIESEEDTEELQTEDSEDPGDSDVSISEDALSENTVSDEVPDEEADDIPVEADMDGMVAGVDYVEGRLIALCDSREEAEALAAYYKGSVESFEYGVAVIALDELSVAQALAMEPYGDHIVDADYIYKNVVDVKEDISGEEVYDDDGPAVPTQKGWGDWYAGPPKGDEFLNVTDDNYQWMHESVRSYGAWGVTTGSSSVRVAVIGSGVDVSHPDFADYGGGNVRAVCNSIGSLAPVDVTGDGTHCAGIIAAGLQNGHEAVGIAPNVKILGIRVADDEGKVDSSALVTAIESVAELKSEWEKVDIIVLDSLIVGRMGSVYSKAEQEAINKAVKAGISVIVGAGDEGSNAKSYPASYDGVISVGAVNRDNSVAAFSNKGTPVDIYAPGVDMASTGLNGSYFKRSSTSVAASVTAGVAALYMSVNGHVSPDKMKNALLEARNMSGEIGVISAAKIFKGDTKSPEVILNDGYGNISGSFYGEDKKSNPTVPGDGYITIKSRNFAGKEGSTGNAVLVYSLDGTAPKVENGELTHGEIFDGTISYNGTIIKDGKTSKKTVTIIAAAITGIGVMSKMTTVTFTIDPKAVSKPLSLRICGVSDDADNPSSIPLGYSIQLRAESSGVDTKTIKWSIKHAEGVSASINSATGLLTTKGGGKKDGYVTVGCKATSPKEIECQVEIKVLAGVDPVGNIGLNTKSEELWYNEEDADTFELVITKYEDINGKSIRYNEFGIDWTSSNEDVAVVEPYEPDDDDEYDKDAWKKATIIAKGAGKCTISCTPMDGSGKSATVSVTVKRLADSFRIDGPQQVVRGKTYQLRATAFEPKESATTNVKWVMESSCDKVKLDPLTGKISIGAKAEVGDTFAVVASAGGCKSEPFEIEIVKGSCKKLVAEPLSGYDKQYYQLKTKKNGSIKSVNLFIKNPAAVENVSENSTMIRVGATGYNKDDDDLGLDTIFSSSDSKIVSVTAGPDGNVTLKAVKKGTATITCTYSDSSRKKTTFTVKVTDPVESIKVSGQSAIVVGKSAQFKAKQVLPETAGNKKVSWSISGNVTGVRISKSGKVKLESTPSVNTVTVVATAADGSGVTGSMDFVVCAAKTKSLVLNTTADPEVYKIKRAKKTDKLQQARLYTVNIPKNGNAENKLTLTTNSAYALDWTSSDTAVAKVEAADGGKGAVVTAVAKGTATITCKALDGSKKKATMKIVVEVPASGVSLVPQDEQSGDFHFLAYGKSVDITASLGKSFGTPTGNKIKWYYEFCNVSVERDDDGNVESIDVDPIEYEYKDLVSIFDFKPVDGKLTMPEYETVKKSGFVEGDDEKDQFIFAITVTAVADEGLGYYASKTFVACHPVKSMSLCYKDIYYNDGDSMAIGVGESSSYEMKGNYGGKGGEFTRLVGGVSVKSSDPAIMSAYYDERQGRLVITGHKSGSVTVTCTAKDGSGKKIQIKVKVSK